MKIALMGAGGMGGWLGRARARPGVRAERSRGLTGAGLPVRGSMRP
jgi:hypothetical protein